MYDGSYLIHHGIKGQRWGVRRYQNADGTLTEAGKIRYVKKAERLVDSYENARRRSIKSSEKTRNYMSKPRVFRSPYKSDRLSRRSTINLKKEERVFKKASSFFEKEVSNFSVKGLNDDQVMRLSELGSGFIDRKKR